MFLYVVPPVHVQSIVHSYPFSTAVKLISFMVKWFRLCYAVWHKCKQDSFISRDSMHGQGTCWYAVWYRLLGRWL